MWIWKKLFWSKPTETDKYEVFDDFVKAKKEAQRDGVAIIYNKYMKIVFEKTEDGIKVTPISLTTGEKGESWRF